MLEEYFPCRSHWVDPAREIKVRAWLESACDYGDTGTFRRQRLNGTFRATQNQAHMGAPGNARPSPTRNGHSDPPPTEPTNAASPHPTRGRILKTSRGVRRHFEQGKWRWVPTSRRLVCCSSGASAKSKRSTKTGLRRGRARWAGVPERVTEMSCRPDKLQGNRGVGQREADRRGAERTAARAR